MKKEPGQIKCKNPFCKKIGFSQEEYILIDGWVFAGLYEGTWKCNHCENRFHIIEDKLFCQFLELKSHRLVFNTSKEIQLISYKGGYQLFTPINNNQKNINKIIKKLGLENFL